MRFLQTVPVQHFLAPGAELLLLPEPRFKRCLIQIHFDCPLDDRSPARTLLAQVVQQGTARYPSRMALARRLEELFGASLQFGGHRAAEAHTMTMGMAWVGERFLPPGEEIVGPLLELATQFLADPLRGPAGELFDPQTLERERDQLLRQIESFADDRASYAEEQFIEALCEGEAFGKPTWGTLEQVKNLSAEDLEEARLDCIQNARVRIMAVGPFDADEMHARFKALFADDAAFASTSRVVQLPPAAVNPGDLRIKREEIEIDQARFHFGFRYQPPKDPVGHEASLLANRVLGGGSQGRLFKIIREERSLAYGIYSTQHTVKGLMTVAAGIDASAFEEVKAEVQLQAAQLGKEGPTEEELELAKIGVLNSMRSIGDSAGSMGHFYGREHRLGFHRTPAQRAEIIQNLDVETVRLAAAGWKEDLCYLLSPPESEVEQSVGTVEQNAAGDAS